MSADLTDPAAFKIEFPEFASADDNLVAAKLGDSILNCDATAWGPLLKQGVYYYTAQTLALSPFARDMKLVSKDGTTVYDNAIAKLTRRITAGYRVTQ